MTRQWMAIATSAPLKQTCYHSGAAMVGTVDWVFDRRKSSRTISMGDTDQDIRMVVDDLVQVQTLATWSNWRSPSDMRVVMRNN